MIVFLRSPGKTFFAKYVFKKVVWFELRLFVFISFAVIVSRCKVLLFILVIAIFVPCLVIIPTFTPRHEKWRSFSKFTTWSWIKMIETFFKIFYPSYFSPFYYGMCLSLLCDMSIWISFIACKVFNNSVQSFHIILFPCFFSLLILFTCLFRSEYLVSA